MLGKRLSDYTPTRPSYEHLDLSTTQAQCTWMHVLQTHENSNFQPSTFRLRWLAFQKRIRLYLDINWLIDSAQRGAWEQTVVINFATNNGN